MKLSVIIPVFNEEKTLKEIVARVQKAKVASEIIIVNDASTDKTEKILKDIKEDKKLSANLTVVTHKINSGKGSAINTGLIKVKGDYVLIQDADLEYDPNDIPKLLKPIKDGKAEVVFGSRFTGEHRNLFFWHMVGNKSLTLLTNILFDTTLSDMETCYKVIPTKILKEMNLKSKRFDFEPEVTAKILKRGIRIYEVPISYAGREYSEGKKIGPKDGLIAIWTLIKYRIFD